MELETLILKSLVSRDDYMRKVMPFLHHEYFHSGPHKFLFNRIAEYITEYDDRPTKDAVGIIVENEDGLGEEEYQESAELAKDIFEPVEEEQNLDWLVDETESFCQNRAIYNSLVKCIQIADGESKDHDKGAIPEIMQDALAVSFDSNVGHDYLDDYEERWEEMHREEKKVPFDVEYFNIITAGGFSTKTLNVLMAGTGVGKTAAMCHFAANALAQGKNVLYVTLEMSRYNIGNRIDANLLNVPLDELQEMSKVEFDKRMKRLRKTIQQGSLKVKEYPPVSASTTHFKHLLNELKLKSKFVPDIIYLDYLNICKSARLGGNSNVNSYEYVKAIAEETRGLAVEFDVPLVTATQTNRNGYSSSDVDLEDVSESFGLPMTADFMVALSTNDDMMSRNQIMVKQLKNRYMDRTAHRKHIVGMDYSKMRLFDTEDQELFDDDGSNMAGGSDFDNNQDIGMADDNKTGRFEGFKV